MTCPVCFENLVKVSSFPKASMLSKTKQQDRQHVRHYNSVLTLMLLRQFVPYPSTVHSTEQVRVRVLGTEVPHIYMGHMSHIYTQWWSLTRLGSHHGTSDKTGLAQRHRSGCAKTAPSPTNGNLNYHHLQRRLPLPGVCVPHSWLVALRAVAVFFGVWKSFTTSTLFFASPVADLVLDVLSRRRTRSCRLSKSDFRVRISAAAFVAHAVISAAQAFNSTVSVGRMASSELNRLGLGLRGFPVISPPRWGTGRYSGAFWGAGRRSLDAWPRSA